MEESGQNRKSYFFLGGGEKKLLLKARSDIKKKSQTWFKMNKNKDTKYK